MNQKKRSSLEKRGWTVGDTKGFLALSEEESTLIDFKLALASSLRARRVRKKLSQVALAKLLSSSQSRVAKMEAGDSSVSLELLLRALLRLGTSPKQIAHVFADV